MRILCAYNVNIDSVYRINGDEISTLIRSMNLDEEDILKKVDDPPGLISSVSDFFSGLIGCMQNGEGAEWIVYKDPVFKFLKSTFFDRSSIRMGGNAGIMANVLSELGADEVIPNVLAPSKTQLSLFSRKSMIIPKEIFRKEVEKKIDSAQNKQINDNRELIHFVFDFDRGDRLSIAGNEIRVPRENRFIATYDTENIKLEIDSGFELYAMRHIHEINGVVVSGFHLLMETYPDSTTYSDRLEKVIMQIRSWKKLNPRLKIHAECGDFSSKEIAYNVFSSLSGSVDSIGMNEDELSMIADIYEIPSKKIKDMDSKAILGVTVKIMSLTSHKKIIIHTRDFIISVFKNNYSSPEVEIESMDFGIKAAATFAATGKLESRKFVESTVADLKESSYGIYQMKKMAEHISGTIYGRGLYAIKDDYTVCIVPSILTEKPVSTVGLGDTVSSATFLRYLELR